MKTVTSVPLLCLTGADASGKSTQAARMAAAWTERGMRVATASIWDALTDPIQRDTLPFDGPAGVHAYLASLGVYARIHFLFHALHVGLDLARRDEPDVILANGYWFKYAATEIAHGADPDVVVGLGSTFLEPEATVHLRIGVDSALSRRSEFTDYEGGFGEDPVAFQTRAHRALDNLGKARNWTILDAGDDVDALTVKALAAFDAAVPALAFGGPL